MRRLVASSLLALSFLAFSACGSSGPDRPVARLEGVVTYNEEPIQVGTVTVVSEDGKYAQSSVITVAGIYVIDKAPCGNVKIHLRFPDLPQHLKDKLAMGDGGPPAPPDAKPAANPDEEPDAETHFKTILSLPNELKDPSSYSWKTNVKEGVVNLYDLKLDRLGDQ